MNVQTQTRTTRTWRRLATPRNVGYAFFALAILVMALGVAPTAQPQQSPAQAQAQELDPSTVEEVQTGPIEQSTTGTQPGEDDDTDTRLGASMSLTTASALELARIASPEEYQLIFQDAGNGRTPIFSEQELLSRSAGAENAFGTTGQHCSKDQTVFSRQPVEGNVSVGGKVLKEFFALFPPVGSPGSELCATTETGEVLYLGKMNIVDLWVGNVHYGQPGTPNGEIPDRLGYLVRARDLLVEGITRRGIHLTIFDPASQGRYFYGPQKGANAQAQPAVVIYK